MADENTIKPTASTPSIDTSKWPLLLKVRYPTISNKNFV